MNIICYLKDDNTFLLTAAGLLIAVLSLWAQLWVSLGNNGENKRSNQIFATIGFYWIFSAIAIAMVAFGILLLNKFFNCNFLHQIPEGLLFASLVMGFVNIIQSIGSIFLKVSMDKTAFDPWANVNEIKSYKCLLVWIVAVGILLSVFSVLAAWNRWFFIGYLPTVIIALILYLKYIKLPQK